jgi:hypothetical protein
MGQGIGHRPHSLIGPWLPNEAPELVQSDR